MAEMMDGRLKTLHPAILGGILADRTNPQHSKDMASHNMAAIDMVVCNLYPFAARLAGGKASTADLIESIDIGGVTLIRAAAKNHAHVTIVTDPADYAEVMAELTDKHSISQATRTRLAAKAIAYTAAYDSVISHWLQLQAEKESSTAHFPPRHFTLAGELAQPLRYGENPQDAAALYRLAGRQPYGITQARLISGKPLGYNNIVDCDQALALVAEFDAPPSMPSIAIIKHGNPCGVASAKTLAAAWAKALAADPVSAFGGIVAVNQKLDVATARAMADLFIEAIIAPEADSDTQGILANKRLLVTGGMPPTDATALETRPVSGGFLVQSKGGTLTDLHGLKTATNRLPSVAEKRAMLFAWRVAKHTTSNAIVFVRDGATLGIGAGQMSRIDAMRLAIDKARTTQKSDSALKSAVLASDGFFPFADSITAAAEAGATAIIQPGGSKRDGEVIAEANKHNMAMIFTGQRAFRH